jgi:peptidoglycan/LPS O-acetylase OafA/YrhL
MPLPRGRIAALDGLRGIAALIVVVHHVFLTVPSFAVAYQFTNPRWSHTWTDTLVFTPLHLIWDGPTAVIVFFVLSGYVLAAPYAAGKVGGWLSYYPQRLLRLYLPVWAALVFALITIAVEPRHVVHGATYFVNLHASTPHGVGEALHNAPLLFKTGWLDSPLWSLRFEVAFSVLLPAAIVWGRAARRYWLVKILLCLIVISVGESMHSLLVEDTPMFGLGTVLAFEVDTIRRYTVRLNSAQWGAIGLWTLLLLSAYWDLWGLGWHSLAAAGTGLSALGACTVVVMVRDWSGAREVTESRVVQWLGKRSFSLYLIHEPIVVAVAFALGGRPEIFATLGIAVPVALVLAEVFYRLVEKPSHQFSRSVGRRVAAFVASRPSRAPTVVSAEAA